MSHTFRNAHGEVVFHQTAKTARGFNQVQKRKAQLVRALLTLNPYWHPENHTPAAMVAARSFLKEGR